MKQNEYQNINPYGPFCTLENSVCIILAFHGMYAPLVSKKKSVFPQAETASPSFLELTSINMESERFLSVLVIQAILLFSIPRISYMYTGLLAHLFLYQGHYQVASTTGN